MDKENLILIILIALMLLITNLNTAYQQSEICIEKIKDAVIQDSDITCIEFLQTLGD